MIFCVSLFPERKWQNTVGVSVKLPGPKAHSDSWCHRIVWHIFGDKHQNHSRVVTGVISELRERQYILLSTTTRWNAPFY